jgi:hypothetical protein
MDLHMASRLTTFGSQGLQLQNGPEERTIAKSLMDRKTVTVLREPIGIPESL